MNEQTSIKTSAHMTRRELLAGATGASLSLMAGTALSGARAQTAVRPNSKFNGVQIGTITYSFRSLPSTAEDILGYVTRCGLSSIELMGGPVEKFAGVPTGGGRRGRRNLTAEQKRAQKKFQDKLLQWRLSVSMERYRALRKLYNDAGVTIHIVKFGSIGNASMSDGEIDYYFKVAQALGARGITRELSEDAARRLAPFADKHRIMIGFHNHTQMRPTTYEGPILSYSKYLGINFDVGHYVAGTNHSPLPILEKYHDRIINLHIKDRKVNNGPNMPFGQGDTPVALILQMIKRQGWTFPADIELEYKVPAGSDAVTEVKRCVQFCKESLA